jgi:tRNA (cytidine/uridine-2'-O-)-methyltransferase
MPNRPFHYHLVLVEPLIPPNTGNAGRLCVGTNSTLHLIEPLGFSIDAKEVRRAGLDYWKFVDLHQHKSFDAWLEWHRNHTENAPFYLVEDTKRPHSSIYDIEYPECAAFVFGKETTGLSQELQERFQDQIVSIPMFSDKIRSLNLSNAISIALYEAIRQQLCRNTRATSMPPSL